MKFRLASSSAMTDNRLAFLDQASFLDGADADFSLRLFNQCLSRRSIERAHGQLYLLSARISGKIFISVVAYQPGAGNSKNYLRGIVEQTLADFCLTAATDEYLPFPESRLSAGHAKG
jgi:hypothetical protein